MGLDHHLHVEVEEAFQRADQRVAVDVVVGGGEVHPHEGVAGEQHLLLGVEEHHVVVAVPRGRQHQQPSGVGGDAVAEPASRFQRGDPPDHGAAPPRQAVRRLEQRRRPLAHENPRPGPSGQPVEVADVFLVSVRRHDGVEPVAPEPGEMALDARPHAG